MVDKTIYKRHDEGKKVAKNLKTTISKIRFKDRDIDITKTIKIGRDDKNDIVLKDDPLISRRHALIEKDGEDYYLTDKGSTNGTYLNNNPIEKDKKIKLSSGDEISIGKTKLQIT